MPLSFFLDSGQAWLMEQKNFIGQSVTYSRGATSVEIAATMGRSGFEITGTDGAFTALETHDSIVDPSLLVINSSEVTPRPGDKITWEVDGSIREYRVLDISGFQNHKYDPLRKTLRIYTKLVGST